MATTIPDKYKDRYIFHMTDIKNLESIIENGLLCKHKVNNQKIQYINIANETIQERRSNMNVPIMKKGTIHNYVPFYFAARTPMLLGVLNSKNCDQQSIIYICLKIDKINTLNAIFTDASANTDAKPNFFSKIEDLDKLSWDLIDCNRWSYKKDEERHKKMAEVLIYQNVAITDIDYIVVFNKDVQNCVNQILNTHNINLPVIFDYQLPSTHHYHCFYTKYLINSHTN